MVEPAAARRTSSVSRDAEARRLLIVGLGNPMMADDGIGHEVIRRLDPCDLPRGTRLVAVDGDVLALTELWSGEPAVWLVDAVSGGRRAGSLRVYGHEELLQLPTGGLSTHQPSVSECLRWILHARPEMSAVEFRFYGIEAGAVRPGRGLTNEVEIAVDRLVEELRVSSRRQPLRQSQSRLGGFWPVLHD